MSNTSITPNMNLIVPTVGVDPGPDYANNINFDIGAIDLHDHSSGKGVQITPAGINVNTDLPMGGNNVITARTVRFANQGAALSGASDLGCAYEANGDLYYNDASGTQIRITQSGAVAGTPGSISNLVSPASAAYVSASSKFTFQSASNTAASIDGGSFIFRNISSGSNGVTVSPPASLPSNYTLVLPALPASQKIMTLDASGNITAPYVVDNATLVISGNTIQVASLGLQTANYNTASITYDKANSNFSPGTIQKRQQYTASGTYSWTAPAGVNYIRIEAVGGGGSGGPGGSSQGGAGGQGCKSQWVPYSVTPGNSYTVVVGAGGASVGGPSGSPGNNGNDTTFDSIAIGKGGLGGGRGSGNGQSPQGFCSPDFTNGAVATGSPSPAYVETVAAGTGQFPSTPNDAALTSGGSGGASSYGTGGYGAMVVGRNSQPGQGYGAGGGGGSYNGVTAKASGAGADGYLAIWY